jgi:hypothetical protein
MSDKFYHPATCFCLPCRALRNEGVKKPAKKSEEQEQPLKKPGKKKRGA